jgi:hypothetical protein
MNSFQWVTSALQIVLALGLTRLLASWVALFRSRRRAHLDWMPIVWSVNAFFALLEFSFAIQGLGSMIETWSFPRFLQLLFLAMVLFVASSLILPNAELHTGESLTTSFELDGRWALAFLAGYETLTNVANWYFWQASPISLIGGINAVLAAMAISFLLLQARSGKVVVTLVFTVINLGAALVLG